MPGYWRSGYFSTDIYQCFIEDACLGDICAYSYEGPLCDTCINNGNMSFFKMPQKGCVQCNDALSSYIIMAIVNYN